MKNRVGNQPLGEIPSLQAWRAAFRQFNTDPTKYRSAPEALLRRLTKKGDIPSINTLVDIGNLMSIRYAIPIAVFDLNTMTLPVTVHFAHGDEHYIELHNDEVVHPEPGEVVFTDVDKTVVARRWCWRQNRDSAASLATSDVVVTIEALHGTATQDVEKAIKEFQTMATQFTHGEYQSKILNINNPRFD